MRIFQSFVAKIFLKNFIILFLALQLFFTGIDLMQNLKNLPDSANLQILYVIFKFLNSINYTLPLSIVFAMLISKFQLIRTNELVSLYALGISKNSLIKPLFVISFFVTLIYIGLNTTTFVNSDDFAKNIKRYGDISSTSSDLFLKSFDTYVYIEQLDPIQKKATNIKLFVTKQNDIKEIIHANKASFKDDYWELREVTITKKPKIDNIKSKKLTFETKDKMQVLHNFRPKIIDNLFEAKSKLTIQDSITAINLLNSQNISTHKIKANLYLMIIFPLFAPIVILGTFYYLPVSGRFFNLAFLGFIFIFGVLILWGILFVLAKVSINGVVSPEIGIVLPIVLLLLLSLFLYYKHK